VYWMIPVPGISTAGRAHWSTSIDEGDHATQIQSQPPDHAITSHIPGRIRELSCEEDNNSATDAEFCIASKHALFPLVCATSLKASVALSIVVVHPALITS
jgi:hypothetical protein